MKTALIERKDVDKSLTWDLSSLYQSEKRYNLALKGLEELTIEIEKNYKENLNNASIINDCLDKMRLIMESEDLISTYVSLEVSTDQSNVENQARYMKSINVLSNIDSRLSFVVSEINEAPDKIIDEAIKESKENGHYLSEIKRFKKHSLHPEVERVLSALSGTLESAYSTYDTTKLSDMDFENFIVDGTEYPLSFVLFEDEWEYETDTKIRRAAFEAFSLKLGEYKNTIA
nr:oligoendopeptidase F [Clostridium sp.]